MGGCPTDEHLEQLLTGGLPPALAESVRLHVRGCGACQATLERLTDHADLRRWTARARARASEPREQPALERLLEALRDTPPEGGTEETATGLPGSPPAFLGPPAQPGELGTLGDYRIQAEVGRGGMGLVFRAYDPSLRRTVALKVLRPDLAATTARQRLVREAQLAAQFRHDHLVRVYAVVDPPDGLPYLVMEYLEGPTLAQHLRARGRLDPREAAALLAQVADGLEAAHQTGLVHRDVKPSNIMLDPASGRAKLMDFGLARAGAVPSGITQEGLLAGTPTYMSPEQVRGQECLDGRSDVYGLGATLYETLTGEAPFHGTPPMVLQQALQDEPRPPRRLDDSIPRDLETVCLKALAKEPGRRYRTARALADDLRRFLQGEPIQARPAGPVERLGRWCRRRPRVAGLSAALLLALAGGFTGVAWQWRRAEAEHQRAELQLEQAQQEHARAEAGYRQARAAVDKYFLEVSNNHLLKEPRLLTLRKKLLEEARDYYQDFLRQHADDDTLLPELAKTARYVGLIAGEMGLQDEAAAAHRQAVAFRARLAQTVPAAAEPRVDLAMSYSELASAEFHRGQTQEALRLLQQARTVWEDLVREHPREVRLRNFLAKNCNHLGMFLGSFGERQQAVALQRQALDLWEQLAREKPVEPWFQHDLARVCFALGMLYQSQNPAEAGRLLRRACAVWEQQQATGSRVGADELANSYLVLGELAEAAGRMTEALQWYDKARAATEPREPDHPDSFSLKTQLAAIYLHLGQLQQRTGPPAAALAALQKACALQEQLNQLTPNAHGTQSTFGMMLHALAAAQWQQGRPGEAVATLRRAITHQRAAFASVAQIAEYRKRLSSHYRELAGVQRALRQPAEAAVTIQEWKKLWPRDAGELYRVASELALCVPVVGKGKAELTPAEQAERGRLTEEALAALREAMRQGFKDREQLRKNPDLAPVRAHPTFQDLLRSLEQTASAKQS